MTDLKSRQTFVCKIPLLAAHSAKGSSAHDDMVSCIQDKHHLQIHLTKLCQTKKVDKARFLGVINIIDEKLTWDDHINYLKSKLLSCIATIKLI